MRELIAEPCTTDTYYLGESCRWDEVRSELLWVDLYSGQLHCATATGAAVDVIRTITVEGSLTAVTPMQDRSAGWLVAIDRSVARLGDDGRVTVLAQPETREGRRMNDGAVDPWGRFWIGSMAHDGRRGGGALYRYHESTGAETVLRGVSVSNGLAWSPDRQRLYYVDSGPATISTFDLDAHGEIQGQRELVRFDAGRDGAPDGICVDAEGAIWVALWGGYEVRRYSPAGEVIATVRLPTAHPASVAIGGVAGTTLYVTTAREDLTPEQLESEPDAGRLFWVDVDVTGLPLNPYRPVLGSA